MKQRLIFFKGDYKEFDGFLIDRSCKRLFLVCDDSIKYMDSFHKHLDHLADLGVEVFYFNDFRSNPLYESVVNGVKLFKNYSCDSIMAVGGGSAIDVAKCIKLYSNQPGEGENGAWLKAESIPDDIPFIAMPTTAGTGSEATRYAVLYYEDVKQSITSESFIPEAVFVDPNALKTLPLYQKKATMCDALCHSIESFWSVNSTDESKEYSRAAIRGVFENMEGYLANTDEGNAGMLHAAHIAGKAINISQTTAGHAMCYKITSLFHCAHGHAAMLCNRMLFPWMIENPDKCVDPRGEDYFISTMEELSHAMGCGDAKEASARLIEFFDSLELEVPEASEEQIDILKNSVNPVRLKNNPVRLDIADIELLYRKILNK